MKYLIFKNREIICNTFNFFECKKVENKISFWGMDIGTKYISLTKDIQEKMLKYNLPFDEIIEIWDDDSYNFYNLVYK
jgi:hypothetical protein